MKLMYALVAAAVALVPFAVLSQPTQVFIVRHAERAPEPKGDPAISTDGVARAEALASALAATDLKAIFTTQYRRTQETAAPTAKRFGLTPKVVGIKPGGAGEHVQELVSEIRKATGSVLVVGHSDTVAGIVAGLSSSNPTKLCETTFSNLFVVFPQNPPLPAAQLKYGNPDVAPQAGCQ